MYDVKEHRMVFPIVHDGKIVDATGRSLASDCQVETVRKKWLAIHIRVW